MKKVLLIVVVFCISLSSCSDDKVIDKEAKEKIERLLNIHKRYAFIDLYSRALQYEEKIQDVANCESLLDISAMELLHEYCLVQDFYSDSHPSYENTNYTKLIDKWIDKEYKAYTSLDDKNMKVTMVFKKVFDFYESKDLEVYIDSLRILFYDKYKKGTLKSLECLEEQEQMRDK